VDFEYQKERTEEIIQKILPNHSRVEIDKPYLIEDVFKRIFGLTHYGWYLIILRNDEEKTKTTQLEVAISIAA